LKQGDNRKQNAENEQDHDKLQQGIKDDQVDHILTMVQLISVSDEILSLLTSKANFEIKTRYACLRVTSKV